MIRDLTSLEPYDSLYLAARTRDVLRSCPGRIESERARGLRILVVGVFDESDQEAALGALLSAAGVDGAFGRMPSAPSRHPAHRSFLSRLSDARPEDEECLQQWAVRLDDLRRAVKAENVYAPLGVGGDIDRRVAHEAALQVFTSGAGRNVFLFEERPQALVPGAIRVRLAELGAQVPPPVAAGLAHGPFLKYLLGAQRSGEGGPRGVVERTRAAWRAVGTRRAAGSWRPEKALGARLQPLLQDGDGAAKVSWTADADPRDSERLARWGRRYAKELGRGGLVERYWLLLPTREPAGTARVARLEEHAP